MMAWKPGNGIPRIGQLTACEEMSTSFDAKPDLSSRSSLSPP